MIKCKNIGKINLLLEIVYTPKNDEFLSILLWVTDHYQQRIIIIKKIPKKYIKIIIIMRCWLKLN